MDTFTAYSVVSTLKDLAASGRTIIATIHQPSSDTFNLFDDLLILADGKVVYQGETAHVIDYFTKQGFQCPQYTNPAGLIKPKE